MDAPPAFDDAASLLAAHAFAQLPRDGAHLACEARAAAVLKGLPVQEFALAILETSLRPDRPAGFDITFGLMRMKGSAPRFADFLSREDFARASPAWSRTAPLLAEWSAGDGALAGLFHLGIELDLRRTGRTLEPNLFFGPKQGCDVEAFFASVAVARAALTGGPDPAVDPTVAALRGLGERCVVTGLGLMIARERAPLRVFIRCLPPTSAGPLLPFLREHGVAETILSLVPVIEPLAPYLCVNLDIDEHSGRIVDNVGLELFFEPGAPKWRETADRLFDALSGRGWMERTRGEVAAGFPGTGRPAPGVYWPRSWTVIDALARPGTGASRVARRLLSVKIVAGASGVTDVKAYLAVYPEVLRRG